VQANEGTTQAVTPSWVWPVLVFGTVVMLVWAWFIVGFLAEPSAVGRSRFILVTSSVYSIGSALLAIVGAVGLARRQRWGRTMAGIAASAMTLTGVGAIAGIPALIGLVSSRSSSRN
jgi:MFS family permease